MEMENPDRSDERCAASERIANDDANKPPMTYIIKKKITSAIRKTVQTQLTTINLYIALSLVALRSGISWIWQSWVD